MFPFLVFAHAGLALVLAPFAWAELRRRQLAVRVSALVGIGLALGLALESAGGAEWRALSLSPRRGLLIATCVASSWLLVAALDGGRGRWDIAALTGISATGLASSTSADWLVPAMLAWLVLSLGVAGVAAHRGPEGPLAIAVSGAVVVAGFCLAWLDGKRSPLAPPGGAAFWVVATGAAVRAGALPRLGAWRSLGHPYAVVLPLIVGSGFMALAAVLGRPEPVASAALFLAAVATAVVGVWRQVPSATASFAVLAGAGAAAASPAAVFAAGASAALTVAIVGLGENGRKHPLGGLVAGWLPPTLGFAVLAHVAAVASTVQTVAWGAVAAQVPLVAAGGVALGSRMTFHSGTPGGTSPLAPTLVAGAAFLLGLAPRTLGGSPQEPYGTGTGILVLAVVATAAAGVVFRAKAAAPDATRSALDESQVDRTEAPRGPRVERMMWVAAICSAVAMAIGTAWLTYEGLRVGFL